MQLTDTENSLLATPAIMSSNNASTRDERGPNQQGNMNPASAGDSTTATNTNTAESQQPSDDDDDYKMMLMLLEQQHKRRLMMARQEQDYNGPSPSSSANRRPCESSECEKP